MAVTEPIGWQEMPTIHTRTWTLQDVRAQVAVILTGQSGKLVTTSNMDVTLAGDLGLRGPDIEDVEWACEDAFDMVVDPEKAAKITTASDLALAVWDDLRLQKRAG